MRETLALSENGLCLAHEHRGYAVLPVEFAADSGRGIAHARDDGRELRFRDAKNLRPILDFVLPANGDARASIALFWLISHDTPPWMFWR